MSNIYFLDSSFDVCGGPSDMFTSVVWSRRFFECGTFTLHAPAEMLPLAESAVYVRSEPMSDGKIRCGRIEHIESGGGECVISGKMLESLFADRLLQGNGKFSGTVSDAVWAAVSSVYGESVERSADSAQISSAVNLYYSWTDLGSWLYRSLKPYGASFTFEFETGGDKPRFCIVKGTDRSSKSTADADKAVFSASLGNISSVEIKRDVVFAKNKAYVCGGDGTLVTLDKSGGGGVREIYKKYDDMILEDFDSAALYTAALGEKAEELLAEHPEAVSVSAECEANAEPLIGRDCFLGDLCDVTDEKSGLSFGLRLTGADEVFENGKASVYPFFGEEADFIKRIREKNGV